MRGSFNLFRFKYLQSLMMFARIIEQSRRDFAAPKRLNFVDVSAPFFPPQFLNSFSSLKSHKTIRCTSSPGRWTRKPHVLATKRPTCDVGFQLKCVEDASFEMIRREPFPESFAITISFVRPFDNVTHSDPWQKAMRRLREETGAARLVPTCQNRLRAIDFC